MSNIIVATFVDGCTTAVTEAIYEGDYGMILQFAGLDLPDVYTVNFGNEAVSPLAHSMIGNADGVEIPNQLLTESGHVMAWVFLHTGEDDGETEYAVTIPVLEKMDTQIDDPTPEQESALNQAIAALNAGVERAETAADSAEQIAADLGDFETAMEAVTEAKNAAQQSASDASTSAGNAAQSAQNAAQSASGAASSAEGAYASEEAAAQSAEDASSSASDAATSATNAAASEAAARAVEESIPEDYTALSDDVSNLKSAFNGYLNGVEKAFQGVASSINKFDFVMIQGIEYTVTNGTSGTISLGIWQSDGTNKTISSQITAGNSVSFTPDRDDYVQFGGWVNVAGTITISSDYSAIEKISDLETEGVETKSNLTTLSGMVDTLTKEEPINITEYATKHEKQFYNVNNAFYSGNQWDYYSLEVTAGDTFTIDTVAGGTIRGWAFRDASGNQLSIASYSGDVVQKEYTNVIAPVNASELLINFKHVSGYLTIIQNDLLVLNENRIFHNGIPLSKYLDRLTEKSNILHGKVLCCCGDSITYGADMPQDGIVTPTIESYQYSAYTKQWTRWTAEEPAAYGYQIAERNGMIFYNGGVSGACVQGSGGTSTVPGFSVADGEYTLLPDNIDYLTLFFGWNDTAFGSLGTINDITNDSYYGGYNVVLPYLINKYPYTKIALIVPFGTDVGHRQAIRDLANKWGLACFDLYKEGAPLYYGKEPDINVEQSIITSNRAKFQANGAHPNYQGHYLISTMLEAFLRGI